jgi:hypothetical protein
MVLRRFDLEVLRDLCVFSPQEYELAVSVILSFLNFLKRDPVLEIFLQNAPSFLIHGINIPNIGVLFKKSLYIYVYVHLAKAWTIGRILFVFNI